MANSLEGLVVVKGLMRVRAQWFKRDQKEISDAIRHISRLEREVMTSGKRKNSEADLLELLAQVDEFCRRGDDVDRYTRNPISRRIEMLLGMKRKRVKS